MPNPFNYHYLDSKILKGAVPALKQRGFNDVEIIFTFLEADTVIISSLKNCIFNLTEKAELEKYRCKISPILEDAIKNLPVKKEDLNFYLENLSVAQQKDFVNLLDNFNY